MEHTVHFWLNGEERTLTASTGDSLLDLLRDELHLYGTRESCGIGMCGACTVLVNGKPLSACLLLVPQVDGQEVLTIEGLSHDGELHPIQQAFIDHNAFQCSYCTPGMILATKALLDENPSPDIDQIKEYLSGNLCRCGSYIEIIDAVQDASRRMVDR